MNLITKTLDICFRRLEPEPIIQNLLMANPFKQSNRYRHWFLSHAESTLGGYSADEQESIFDYFREWGKTHYSSHESLPPLYLLVDLADGVLEAGSSCPLCRYEKTLEWRDAFLLLGQDIFTTAWMACRPCIHAIRFSWPITIPVNNRILNSLMQGADENHLHLFAGAATFGLSWACLMNHPRTILSKEVRREFGEQLQMNMSREPGSECWSLQRCMIYAAEIRVLLFKRIHGEMCSCQQAFRDFHRSFLSENAACAAIERDIDAIRWIYGLFFPQPQGGRACLDYAFTEELCTECNEDLRLLAAERKLLYDCFQACFRNRFSPFEQWLFYVYLLLKSRFRSEMIQVNQQVGFRNFQLYDHRKYFLWREIPEYWNEDYRQSINASFRLQKLRSLEGRLSPKDSADENLDAIYSIDRAKLFYDAEDRKKREKLRRWHMSWYMKNRASGEPYHFVIHFAKQKDQEALSSMGSISLKCRHEAYRKEVRTKAIQLALALSNSDYLCHRIRGYDACSNEIGCRPEVFAVAFRFLRSFKPDQFRILPFSKTNPYLSATYHAGEDYLDIADGLRAMDEAILFTDMRRGDRLGHALALGVEPKLHYRTKHYQIIQPKQDRLDDLVWLLFRSTEFEVEIPEPLRSKLYELASELFADIYGACVEGSGYKASVTLQDYYHSMFLRGDNPVCYSAGVFKRAREYHVFDIFNVNNRTEIKERIEVFRNRKQTAFLYFCYHFRADARQKGNKTETFSVEQAYISLMGKMQEAMRRRIEDLGISVECNPSSNVLIGTFSDYQNHPILTFNNECLNIPRNEVQMHVSVNSDNPGVFDTTLSFEYSLLAATLSQMVDERGNRIHTDREIEKYIQNLVQMGHEQCFPEII